MQWKFAVEPWAPLSPKYKPCPCTKVPELSDKHQEIVDYAFSQLALGECPRKLVRVENFTSQVVAGVSYAFDLVLANTGTPFFKNQISCWIIGHILLYSMKHVKKLLPNCEMNRNLFLILYLLYNPKDFGSVYFFFSIKYHSFFPKTFWIFFQKLIWYLWKWKPFVI